MEKTVIREIKKMKREREKTAALKRKSVANQTRAIGSMWSL